MLDLEKSGHLVRIEQEIDPCLEAAEVQRRVFQAGGPALWFQRVKGCRFEMVSNLFGSIERVRYIFRDSLPGVKQAVGMKANPAAGLKRPWICWPAAKAGWNMLPRWVSSGPVLAHQTTVDQLPQVKSWPLDGGAFITLPQVYTEHPDAPGLFRSNLGMYRVQLSGGAYQPNQEIGLHYQIHRGIGVHHTAAVRRGERLKVNIFVGGPPAMTVSAVMPLPEGFPEICFAGALGGRAVRMIHRPGALPIPAEADFCITGTIDPDRLLPEGPFGDHLGYYSLAHDFPVLHVDAVYHRPNAIWPFTTVGRPPQEDTLFGQIIHEITGPVIPAVLPGVQAVHAVDASGVHPLLLAIGSERYVPYVERTRPQELLTQAHAILGQGQMSLAKYLLIVARNDNSQLDIHHIDEFFQHLLCRIDWTRDLHFQTSTTIDTLDYTGRRLNEGSKVVLAAVGPPLRTLPTEIPNDWQLPDAFRNPCVCLPGVLAITSPPYSADETGRDASLARFCQSIHRDSPLNTFPLIVLVDDSEFTAHSLNNFLWITFTRSNPAADIDGVDSFHHEKHWGCRGSLVIDARLKPYMPPVLAADPAITRRVDSLFSSTGPLHGLE